MKNLSTPKSFFNSPYEKIKKSGSIFSLFEETKFVLTSTKILDKKL